MKNKNKKCKVEEEFEDIIRNKMTDKQFAKWAMGWLDVEEIVEMALEWEIDVKEDELKELRKIIK